MLFTFPSRYWFTIGRQEYLALEGGPPSFPRDFTGPAVLKYQPRAGSRFAYGTLTRSGRPSQIVRLDPSHQRAVWCQLYQVLQPHIRNATRLGTDTVWAYTPFAHHYLGYLG